MILIEDTRQQAGKHTAKHKYWEEHGIQVFRSKLIVGDYTYVGSPIFVDTKASVEEIAGNIGGAQHTRFREECKKAKYLGARLVILVENEYGYGSIDDVAAWANPNPNKTARSIDGARLSKAMDTMSKRYGVRFEFCTPEDAGRRVIELLEAEHDK